MRTDIDNYQLEDDCLGNFQEDEVVYLNRGGADEQIVTIIGFHAGLCIIKDNNGQKFPVSALRLTKP